jgi:hypothetical protein
VCLVLTVLALRPPQHIVLVRLEPWLTQTELPKDSSAVITSTIVDNGHLQAGWKDGGRDWWY